MFQSQVSVLLIVLGCHLNTLAQNFPLPLAHAHNDYNHKQPLFDAIKFGFTSIEADVLLIDDELFVGHDLPESKQVFPTLIELYLNPLDSIIKSNKGFLYPGYSGLCYLMIDIKSGAQETYTLLYKQLEPYRSWIYSPKINPDGRIVIYLSGNRPIKQVLNDPDQLLSLDGRPDDLGKGYTSDQMPVVSQAFYMYSQWSGEGDMNLEDQARIKDLADRVHKENKRLRLWAHPDNPDGWDFLQDLGVDIINSDDLEGLSQYLQNK